MKLKNGLTALALSLLLLTACEKNQNPSVITSEFVEYTPEFIDCVADSIESSMTVEGLYPECIIEALKDWCVGVADC